MKIVVTAGETGLAGPVDPRFGRAAKLILCDTESGRHEVHDNTQNLHAAQGAGIQAAQNAANLGAEVVLTGHCGPKAFRVLQAAGVKVVVGVSGSIDEALAKFQAGEFVFTESADVEGHW